jgi:hypothetical protein
VITLNLAPEELNLLREAVTLAYAHTTEGARLRALADLEDKLRQHQKCSVCNAQPKGHALNRWCPGEKP